MTSEQLVMYVQNTGSMYEGNCQMAKQHRDFTAWYARALRGLKLMRKEYHEPNEGMSEAELQEAARQLKTYYEEHIKEMVK